MISEKNVIDEDYKEPKQQTKEWLQRRQKGIGASDCPIVMGSSPYKTRYKLWAEKCGIEEAEEAGFAAKRGIILEPMARAIYEVQTGNRVEPKLVQMREYPFMMASLDGWNQEKEIVLEIKCNGKENHAIALEGRLPLYHEQQVQHQLLVSGAKLAHYFSYNDGYGKLVEVEANHKMQAEILEACEAFWKLVETKTPPELSEKDYVYIKDDRMLDLAGAYKDIDESIKAMEETKEGIRKQILLHVKHPRTKIGNLSISTVYTKGNVDYKKIPELKNVDLDQYRGKGYNKTTFRIDKNF